MRRRARAGFTFVELLLTVTVGAILMVGLVLHLRGGLLAWQRANAAVDELQQWRQALSRLEQDLANAVMFDVREDAAPATRFGSGAMQFFTVRDGVNAPAASAGVRFVSYEITDVDNVPTLVRTVQTVQGAYAGLPGRTEAVLPGVDSLALRYGYQDPQDAPQLIWRGDWDGKTQVPRLVDVTLTVRSVEGGGTVPLHEIIAIPGGSLKQPEGT